MPSPDWDGPTPGTADDTSVGQKDVVDLHYYACTAPAVPRRIDGTNIDHPVSSYICVPL